MELDVVIEWDDRTQWCLTKERDEIAADWEKDEDHVDVQNQSGSTGESCIFRAK
jgi:hypothetical protein